ncbi:MAG: flagellar hook-basal body complex protein FliE [Thermanaerothrix sp.]|nr:flagellar hook-basal body complex protein FliE [Thermanaerothrix sp.]
MDVVRLDLSRYGVLGARSGVPSAQTPSSPVTPFEEVLKSSMKQVNSLQMGADQMVRRLSLGEVDDVSQVSVAVEKAELALRTLVEIRNKLVDAYQQISRMPV